MSARSELLRTHDDAPAGDQYVRLHGARWDDYERLVALRGERAVPRITFLRGTLEIMSPSQDHETIKSFLGHLLESWCVDRGIDFVPAGAWTVKNRDEERGSEADECYLFGARIAAKDHPDLALEVEWTRGGIDKLEVWCALGVPEVWRWRKGTIHVHVLRDGTYVEAARSELLPELDLALLASFVDRPTLTQAVRDFRAALAR